MIDKLTYAYTLGRLVALVEQALDEVPPAFASKSIKSPLGFFFPWYRRAAIKEVEHQKIMSEITNALDATLAFPASLTAPEQTKAWEGYNRQKVTDARALLGRKISEKRRLKGLTQEELSALSGVTSTNISKIEKGKYNVSIDLLNKIMIALDAEISIAD